MVKSKIVKSRKKDHSLSTSQGHNGLVVHEYRDAFGFATPDRLYIVGIKPMLRGSTNQRSGRSMAYQVVETGNRLIHNKPVPMLFSDYFDLETARRLIQERLQAQVQELGQDLAVVSEEANSSTNHNNHSSAVQIFTYDNCFGFATPFEVYFTGITKKIMGNDPTPDSSLKIVYNIFEAGTKFLQPNNNAIYYIEDTRDYDLAVRRLVTRIVNEAGKVARIHGLEFNKDSEAQRLFRERKTRFTDLSLKV